MKRALVVDDTKSIRTLLTTCLEIEDYIVSSANNGQEAIELFKNEMFDLAFLDIKMPEISGTEVLRKIRDMGIDIPVIIMTAYATIKNAVDCTKLGAVSYLQKPFTAEKVRNILYQMQSEKEVEDNSLHYYIRLAKELIESNKLDDAFEYLKKGWTLDPSCFQVYLLIGRIYENKGDNDLAKKFYNTAKLFEIEESTLLT